ncbi:MAG: hypothetical protein Q4E02_00355 [Lagierella massiliensis]|nr:hypothetical protein [Lagierella massiliensis]
MKKEAEIEKILEYPIEQVWEIFTNREDYSWRNEVIDFVKTSEKTFKETNSNNLTTEYKILTLKPMEFFEIEMKNKIIEGVFSIVFIKLGERSTKVRLKQVNSYKNKLVYLANSFFLNLEKVLNLYIFQVENELKKRNITIK